MKDKETLKLIINARDSIIEAKRNIKCTCSGFVLQYEGSCGCGSRDEVIKAENSFWDLINNIRTVD